MSEHIKHTKHTLWCIIAGTWDFLPIEIDMNKSVGALKKAIKEVATHEFRDFDAHTLILHKMDVRLDGGQPVKEVQAICEDLNKPQAVKPLDGWKPLSKVFEEPTPSEPTLQILIKKPVAGESINSTGVWRRVS